MKRLFSAHKKLFVLAGLLIVLIIYVCTSWRHYIIGKNHISVKNSASFIVVTTYRMNYDFTSVHDVNAYLLTGNKMADLIKVLNESLQVLRPQYIDFGAGR